MFCSHLIFLTGLRKTDSRKLRQRPADRVNILHNGKTLCDDQPYIGFLFASQRVQITTSHTHTHIRTYTYRHTHTQTYTNTHKSITKDVNYIYARAPTCVDPSYKSTRKILMCNSGLGLYSFIISQLHSLGLLYT